MKVGLLVLTHNGIGPALLGTVKRILDIPTVPAKLLTTGNGDVPEQLAANIEEVIEILDNGNGVLVLTDLAASTPCNIVAGLARGKNIRIVSGVNIPMLLRVLNYPDLDLPDLVDKAVSGGRDGIYNLKAGQNDT